MSAAPFIHRDVCSSCQRIKRSCMVAHNFSRFLMQNCHESGALFRLETICVNSYNLLEYMAPGGTLDLHYYHCLVPYMSHLLIGCDKTSLTLKLNEFLNFLFAPRGVVKIFFYILEKKINFIIF